MLSWVTSWWSSGTFTGPARNAPNNGVDIKKFFDQRPKQVITVTSVEIQTTLKGLKKAETNAVPPASNKPPIMKEFDSVFDQGYKEYFVVLKKQREIISDKVESKAEVLAKLRKKPIVLPKEPIITKTPYIRNKSSVSANPAQPIIGPMTQSDVATQQTPAIALSVPAPSDSSSIPQNCSIAGLMTQSDAATEQIPVVALSVTDVSPAPIPQNCLASIETPSLNIDVTFSKEEIAAELVEFEDV